MLETFLSAIHAKKLVEIVFDSKDEGAKKRICVPFDFGPSRRNLSPNPDRYHFYDLNSPNGNHTLSITPDQLLSISILDDIFEPGQYVTWQPNWFISRDWGQHS